MGPLLSGGVLVSGARPEQGWRWSGGHSGQHGGNSRTGLGWRQLEVWGYSLGRGQPLKGCTMGESGFPFVIRGLMPQELQPGA